MAICSKVALVGNDVSFSLIAVDAVDAGFKAICDHVPGWKPWANLMSATGGETGPPDLVPGPVPPTVDLDQTMVMDEPLQEATRR